MRSRSIKTRLLLIGALTTGVALTSMAAVLLLRDWLGLREELLERMAVQAAIVGDNCTAALTFDDRRTARETLSSLRGAPEVQQAVVFDKAGAPFATFSRSGQDEPVPPPGDGPSRVVSLDRAVIFQPILQQGERLGTLYIRSDTARIERRMARNVGFVLLLLALSLVVALSLLWGLQRAITGPVLELAAMMHRIGESQDYSVRSRLVTRDELGVLVSGFNDMLGRIEQRDEALARQRQDLEVEVGRRTAELAATNSRLQEELAERKRMEQALVAAAAEWRTTFDAIGEGLTVVDPEGRILRCNRAAGAQLGEDPKALCGRQLFELLGVGASLQDEVRRTQRPAKAVQKLGSRWLEMTLEPMLDECGTLTRSVHLMSDITERRELQEQLSHSQKMEAVGRLAGGVAHDFNNILAVILTSCGFVLEEAAEGSVLRTDILEIQAAAARAQGLTRQLLAFSRKQVVKPGVLKVGEAIASLSKMIGRLIGENIVLHQHLDEEAGSIWIDRAQFEQVLVNILVNARDAMPDGGELTIAARGTALDESDPRCRAGTSRPGAYALISVTDTGVGMSKDLMQRIFEPFFTTKGPGKGTGLGLAIVYGAVKQNGGLVEVRSEEGVGTTFDLYFPRVASDASAPAVALREKGPRGAGEQVLLVEDDPQLRRALHKLLELNGYRVLAAINGEEALQKLAGAAEPIQVVVTDIVMPGMGGLALGKRIAERMGSLPILYMSGYSEEVLALKGSSQLEAILSKPFEDNVLLSRLRGVLDARKASAA